MDATAHAALRVLLDVHEASVASELRCELQRIRREEHRMQGAYHFQQTMGRFAKTALREANRGHLLLYGFHEQRLVNVVLSEDTMIFVEPSLSEASYLLHDDRVILLADLEP